MPAEKEGVRALPGKPRRRLRKPEQDVDRGTEIPKRTILPERCTNLGLTDTRENVVVVFHSAKLLTLRLNCTVI